MGAGSTHLALIFLPARQELHKKARRARLHEPEPGRWYSSFIMPGKHSQLLFSTNMI